MRVLFASLAATLLAALPAGAASAANDRPAYSLQVFLDDYGNEIGYFVVYCDGSTEMSGERSGNSYTNYGTCTLQ